MGLLKRAWNLMLGRVSRALDRAEEPEDQLAAFVADLNRDIERLKGAVAAAMADEKRLKMQIEDLLGKAADWESRAVLALREGNEPLAREALRAKEQCEARSLALQKAWETQREAVERLKASLRTAGARVTEAKTRYTLLLAQYRSAQTKQRLQQTLSASAADSPAQLMERLSERIQLLEAQTEAAAEVEGGDPTVDLEATFADLERRTRGDEALRQLKEKLGAPRRLAGPAEPVPGSGSGPTRSGRP